MRAMIDAAPRACTSRTSSPREEMRPHGRQGCWVPTREAVQKLIAARLAADVAGVPTLLLARTDAERQPGSLRISTRTTGLSSPASARRKASTA